MEKEELRAFCQDLYTMISFIKGRFFTVPPPDWTLISNDQSVPEHLLDQAIQLIYCWYAANFDHEIDQSLSTHKKLDIIRSKVQKWSYEVMY